MVRVEFFRVSIFLAISLSTSGVLPADEFSNQLNKLRSVKSNGDGNTRAVDGWRAIVAADASRLPEILVAIDGAGPLAANWLRSAVDTIAERQLHNNGDLPRQSLEKYILDRSHDPRGRRLAYEWLLQVDPGCADRLLPNMTDDPSVELRRDAVARLIKQGQLVLKNKPPSAAIDVYRRALTAARDEDQVREIAKQLRKLGEDVNLARHFGFLMTWNVVAPFDNTERKGFQAAYPPEKELVLDGVYQGKAAKVKWLNHTTEDEFGMVDLNVPFGKLKEVVGYAWTSFRCEKEQQVELRIGCKNAWKLWVNGVLVFERNEYHRGMRMDQYRFPLKLKAGDNQIVMKLCQNEQLEDWTVQWQFQLRVCDATGTAILSDLRH